MGIAIIVLIIVLVIGAIIGAVIGKKTMERQQRIIRMKRFRREARTRKIEFDSTDRRTVV